MGAKIPCYFSAHGPRRTALVCQAGPAAAASFAFRRLLTRRLNPHLFKCLWLFITDLPVFSFPEARLMLKCQRAALATFEPTPFFTGDKNIRLCWLASGILHHGCFIETSPTGERTATERRAGRRINPIAMCSSNLVGATFRPSGRGRRNPARQFQQRRFTRCVPPAFATRQWRAISARPRKRRRSHCRY